MVKQYDRTDPRLPAQTKCTPHQWKSGHWPVGVNKPQSPSLTRNCSSSVVCHLLSRRLFGLNDVLQFENHRDVMFWENMSGSSRGSFRLSLPSNHVYSGPPWYDVPPYRTDRRVTGPSDTRLSHHTTRRSSESLITEKARSITEVRIRQRSISLTSGHNYLLLH